MTIWPVACPKPVRSAAALALVLLVEADRQVGLGRLPLAEQLGRAVLRAVVDEDDLLRDRHGADLADDLGERVHLVVDGDHDREDQVVGDLEDPQVTAGGLAEEAGEGLVVGLVRRVGDLRGSRCVRGRRRSSRTSGDRPRDRRPSARGRGRSVRADYRTAESSERNPPPRPRRFEMTRPAPRKPWRRADLAVGSRGSGPRGRRSPTRGGHGGDCGGGCGGTPGIVTPGAGAAGTGGVVVIGAVAPGTGAVGAASGAGVVTVVAPGSRSSAPSRPRPASRGSACRRGPNRSTTSGPSPTSGRSRRPGRPACTTRRPPGSCPRSSRRPGSARRSRRSSRRHSSRRRSSHRGSCGRRGRRRRGRNASGRRSSRRSTPSSSYRSTTSSTRRSSRRRPRSTTSSTRCSTTRRAACCSWSSRRSSRRRSSRRCTPGAQLM